MRRRGGKGGGRGGGGGGGGGGVIRGEVQNRRIMIPVYEGSEGGWGRRLE